MKQKLLLGITKSNWGGAQKAVYDLATHPRIYNNYDVTVMSGSEGELIKKLQDKNIKTKVVNIKNNLNIFQAIGNFYELYKYIKKEKPDIIHLHSSKISLFGAIASRLAGITLIVFTAHAWPHNEDRNIFVKLLLRLLSIITVLFAHRTIAVSDNLIKTLKAPNFIKKKITLVYNGIKNEVYKKLPKLSGGSKIKHIVSLGELNDNKHHASVLKILPQIKNIHYHIIGEGTHRSKLEELIKDKKLGKRVTLYGHINNAKDLLSQYDVFLLPSKTEALGYVVLEALQAGLPVIARAVGGVPEILKGLSYGKLYKYDTDLIDLLSAEVHKEFKWKDSRFDFEKMIEKTLYLYK